MVCKCDAPTCRGVLTCQEWRSPPFQKRYKGHVTSLIQRKIQEIGWYDPRVYLRRLSDDSRGLFLLEPVRQGEVMLMFGGKIVPTSDFLQLEPHLRPLSLQIAEDFWQIPAREWAETADYINHSCDPTCVVHGTLMIVSRFDVPAGAQVTMDYATVDPHMYDCFQCECGASDCRRNISGTDCKDPNLIRKYWPHVSQVVRDVILADPVAREHVPAAFANSINPQRRSEGEKL
eukprot:TRINITY_DN232_c0_g1_i1.p1 TRINITY_DN232_c0_g1~~TRINITY_DN232_c0_g1_i1.p1  ORF type:complete len:232 (+),score=27.83 TRINITY_DN232_c0_g1_i1:453-1148(+)